MISSDTIKRLMIALTLKSAGQEVANAIDANTTLSAQSAFSMPAAIVATSVSPTTDFAALAVGDLVVHIPAVAGNSEFFTVATAGTLPAAAVVGDLYIVLRAVPATAATTVTL